MKTPRVALVHDYLWTVGGAEKVVEALAQAYPEAPIYTSFLLSDKVIAEGFQTDLQRVKTTWMQWLPFKRQLYKVYFLLYPLAFRALKLQGYDVVISSSSYAAINTTVSPGTLHLCYCHTPSRYLYGYDTELDHAKIKRYFPLIESLYFLVRRWDQQASKKVDYFLTNSLEVKGRIKKHYDREAFVVYPPVEIDKFKAGESRDEGYYFTYGRLVAHKRVDIIVEAFNKLGWPLKISGTGLELNNLQKIAKPNVEFLGRVDDRELKKQLLGCTALIFAAEEDFGIVPVEAMAAGKPVIAFKAGGVLESVLPGKTGAFFSPQTALALLETLSKFDPKDYDQKFIQNQAESFDKIHFQAKIKQLVEKLWQTKITATS